MSAAGRAVARISEQALRHNVAQLSGLVAPAATMLAVKSDAYGHGLLSCVRTGLESGASWLGVLEIGTGLALRAAGVDAPMFAWMHGRDADFRSAVEQRIDLGAAFIAHLDGAAEGARSAGDAGPARVHLKIDTGLHRSGANPEDWPTLVEHALELQRAGLVRIVGAWSHLSDTSHEADLEALARFEAAVAVARDLGAEFELLHLAASSAAIDLPAARFDLVRFGIAAYGISPFHDRSGRDLGLVPVMSLRAPVTHLDGARATIAIGYGDGLQSLAGAEREVLLGGRRQPIVHVGVDESVVELSGARITVGDEAIVFGTGDDGEPTAEEWAAWNDTVPDELVTGVTTRVPRVVV
ncbi:alanine racemase [Pseudoclavibacter chungangensis]|uniref:alanine racemase n=1 Tax=Pseudoclavibacter chungangensis TaxID=587635 RepID=UPI0017F5589B|nr:alanine racemase [Pseudoclavibacter chungangensis]NYJ66449.1 alanine racemase [Pseudoclavibacter chungangensis]